MTNEQTEKVESRPVKTGYNLYSLQSLQSEKFVKLVEKVLRQEFYLVR